MTHFWWFDFLDRSGPDEAVIDAFRWIAVAVAVYQFVMALSYFRGPCRRKESWLNYQILFNAGTCLLFAVQELQQTGKPFLYWRLPSILVLEALVVAAAHKRRKHIK